MPELYLVRHAQASFGTEDYDRLSELGHRQSRWLGEYFRYRGLEFGLVVCGEMVRHHETASGIAAGMGSDGGTARTDAGWNEFDFEAVYQAYLAGHPDERPDEPTSTRDFAKVFRRALLAWSGGRLDDALLPEGWTHFEERVRTALAAAAQGEGRVLVVSSGGPISMALRQVLDAPPSAMIQMNLQVRNSSFSQLYFNRESLHFYGFNHIPHLDHPERAGAVTWY